MCVCVCLSEGVWAAQLNLSLSEWLQKQKDIKILFTQTQRIQFNSIHLCVCKCVGGSACWWVCVRVCGMQCSRQQKQQQIVYHSSVPFALYHKTVCPPFGPISLSPSSVIVLHPSSFLSLLHETIDQFDCSNLWAKAQSVRQLSCNIRCTRSDSNIHSNGAISS